MIIAIGCDEAGFDLKNRIIQTLQETVTFIDVGSLEDQKVLYPDIALEVSNLVISQKAERGILICGTGIGMSITANKIKGIRASVCHDYFSTVRSVKSNDANVMCLGQRVIGFESAISLVEIWLKLEFEGGNSKKKVDRLNEIDLRKE